MRNVLVVLDNDLVNDGRVLKELAIYNKHNINYKVLCYDYGGEYGSNKNVIRIKNGKFLKYKLEAIVNTIPLITKIWRNNILRVLKHFKADVIHVHDLYMMPPVIKALNSLIDKPKVIVDLHENFPFAIYNYEYATKGLKKFLVKPQLWKKKEKKILNNADGIIVLDETFGESLTIKYPNLKNKKIIEFPNYPDYSILDKNEPIDFYIDPSKKHMLYFGGIAKSRGITETILAFEKIVKTENRYNFLIIGPVNGGYMTEFDKLITRPNVKDHIQYIPWIKTTQLMQVMKLCDFAIAPFHVNPQIESGIANKIFQYLYGSLPVIVSNARPQAKLIRDNNCGIIFKTDKDLESAIKEYFENDSKVLKHGNNGKEIILKDFMPEKFENKLIELIETI